MLAARLSRRAQTSLRCAGNCLPLPDGMDRTSVVRRCLIGAAVATTTLAMLALGGFAAAPAASAAASAPAATQCNAPAFPTGAGFQVTCTITVDNTVTSAGATTSRVTGTACLAAAGVLPPFGCTTTVTASNQLVTSVNQCNGIAYGGGSNVMCKVAVVNTTPAGTSAPGVSVDQCIGSGTGGGTQPTVVCSPSASTTNATVTQCNGSGNGGGASTRVKCTVTGGATALPMTITQCDGSANGGGSTVSCTTAFSNNYEAASQSTTTTPASSTVATTPAAVPRAGPIGGGTKGVGPPRAGGPGGTGTTGRSPRGGGPTGTFGSVLAPPSGVIPVGPPQTGLGGASHSTNDDLVILGILSLIGSALATVLALRRRQFLLIRGRTASP